MSIFAEGPMHRQLPVLILAAFLAFYPSKIFSQTLSGRLTTSVYSYQQYDSLNKKSNHLRAYQLAEFAIAKGNVSFTTYLQGSTDFFGGIESDPHLRAYNVYLDIRRIARVADLRLGRQLIFAGVGRSMLDGLSLKLSPYHDVTLFAYIGGLPPADGSLKSVSSGLSDNYLYGAEVTTSLIPYTRISLSYINRHRLPESYQATRFDTTQPDGFRRYEFQSSSTAEQYAGINASLQLPSRLMFYGRLDYDLNLLRPQWGEFSLWVPATNKLTFTAELVYRQPRLPYNSIFSVFDHRSNLEIRAGANYAITQRTQAFVRFGTITYEGDNGSTSTRITLGASTQYGSFTYSKDVGFAGKMDIISVQALYPIISRSFMLTGGISYGRYKLDPNLGPTETVLTALGGVRYQPLPTVTFDVQGQFLSNHVYSSDARIFLRGSYWFFSKLR